MGWGYGGSPEWTFRVPRLVKDFNDLDGAPVLVHVPRVDRAVEVDPRFLRRYLGSGWWVEEILDGGRTGAGPFRPTTDGLI